MAMDDMMDEVYEEENVIELEDDEGNVEKFLHVATFEYKNAWYCVFQHAEPESEDEEDEVVIFRREGEDEEMRLYEIEDEALLDEVFAEFCHQYEEYERSEEAKKLDV